MPEIDMAAHELNFQQMWAEWSALEATELKKWETTFDDMAKERSELVRSGQWLRGHDNLLEIIGCARKETFHSAMLAWLMDPAGRHGFGPEFLLRVISKVDGGERARGPQDVDLLATCRADTEVWAPRSRADIVVRGHGVYIVFEVKVDADEGPTQCARLMKDHDGADFVFVDRNQAPLTSCGEDDAQNWGRLTFSDVRNILSELITGRPAGGAVDATLRTYLSTLERQF